MNPDPEKTPDIWPDLDPDPVHLWQWHQLGHMLQTDNHASTPPLSFLQAGCPSCRPTKSVEALKALIKHIQILNYYIAYSQTQGTFLVTVNLFSQYVQFSDKLGKPNFLFLELFAVLMCTCAGPCWVCQLLDME